MWNGNSAYSNSNSFSDRDARTLPWLFRVLVPGLEGGWPV